ncbi:MAG: glucose-1-phosphate cytidylyltransferase [Aureliella sp.]
MKVVLFCGGQGMRLREHSAGIPKPMVPVGDRPILWHLMRYYAHYGHTDFVLCLGWNGEYIREYFANLSNEDQRLSIDWHIECVDTGLDSPVGQRLCKVKPLLAGEQTFLANYADGLSDVDLNAIVAHHRRLKATATCLCVKPTQSFHLVDSVDGLAASIKPVSQTRQWMNGGYFVFEQAIFDVIHDGEDLATEPFGRLIRQQKLACFDYRGFWGCMDTYKEKQDLDDMFNQNNTPWAVWDHTARPARLKVN